MGRRLAWLGGLVVVLAGVGADAPPEWISGRVVDDAGHPVADVDVTTYWSANGWKLDGNGMVVGSVNTEAEVAEFWSRVGQMEPVGKPTRTGTDGAFRVSSNRRTHQVLALDAARSRGGLGIVPAGQENQPITIRLGRLVRVRGVIRGPAPGEKPPWTHTYTERAEDPERPVDSFRIAGCGSFNADFAMLLPPGRYRFQAYDRDFRGEVAPYPELTITGAEPVIDLGTLQLSLRPEALVPRLARIRDEKHLRPLKDYTGEAPPTLFADDARGVPRDWQAGRAPGKWQVVEFWGVDCPACLSRSLPDLLAFQEQHAAQADRFEIVTVFLDVVGKIRTIAAMDEALKPIIRHTWCGKPLTLPTLVDPSTRTAESFGLSGLGEMILINPEGRIVAGDLDTLARALDAR